MSEYVLAHHGDDAERQRLALLHEFHGRLTLTQLQAAAVRPGWRCLDVGAGTGAMTSWLAERVAPTGHVLAMDLETHWLEPLRSEIVEVCQGDITRTELPPNRFNLVMAQMLLLHLPDPSQTCRQLLEATVPGGQLIIHDADFTPVAIHNATELEATGVTVMADTMRAAGAHLALGPELETLLRDAGAQIEHIESQPWVGRGGETAALITAITLERFRDRAMGAGVSNWSVNAAIAALHDPERTFTGPTRWIVRCHRSGRH
jgi:2-polyprenyl-3-methyl-5-hydroxy-6-metoxy-1,4-benzoquinol methylase